MSSIHVNHLSEVGERQPTLVAIGSFDGVHRGHQELLGRMVTQARALEMRSAVLTFFPHPKRVLLGLEGRHYLSRLSERVEVLSELGVDLVITHPFDETVHHTRAADFVDQLLRYLDMRQLWGGNFALGYQREGDIPFLRRLGREKGYTVEVANAMVEQDGELVSSSRVRRSLERGEVAEAHRCLGRPYLVSGAVVRGDQRGRTIGFPTANLDEWDEQLLPAHGVYAAYAWVRQRRFAAATNVGVRPTVDGGSVTVEAHLLDFDEEIYGQQIRVEFMHRIRAEMKFSGLDALKSQIDADVVETRRLLGQG